MSTSCTSTPTATSTQLVTSSTVSTSFSEQVTTIPGTTSFILSTSCASFSTPTDSASAAPVCVSTETATIGTTTIGGGVQTTSVPVLTTITAVSTEFATLFGSVCTTIRGSSNNNTTAPSSPTVSVVTPPPSVITTQSSSTLPNGDVTVVVVTSTSIVPPSSFTVTSTDAAGPASNNPSSAHSTSNHLGAIIGGTVGGIFAVIVLLVAIRCFIVRRQRRWDDIFEHDIPAVMAQRSDRGDFSLADEIEPKPYEFGAVGSSTSNAHSPYSMDSHNPSTRPPTSGSNQGYHSSSSPSTHLLFSSPSPETSNNNPPPPPSSPERKERHAPAAVTPASPTEAAGRDDYFDYQHLNFYSSVDGGGGGERKLQVVNGDDTRRMSLATLNTLNQGPPHLDLKASPGDTIVEGELKGVGAGGSPDSSHGKSTALPSTASPTHFFRDATTMRPVISHRGS